MGCQPVKSVEDKTRIVLGGVAWRCRSRRQRAERLPRRCRCRSGVKRPWSVAGKCSRWVPRAGRRPASSSWPRRSSSSTLLWVRLTWSCGSRKKGVRCMGLRRARFAAWVASKRHITHVRTRNRAPWSNGMIERFFKATKNEHCYRRDELAAQTNIYRAIYNQVQSHEAIAMTRPLDRYQQTPTTQPKNEESVSDS